MKINQLSYYDHKREWRLEPIQFSNMNLLVGVSGVGKSQILESINTLKKITTGESFNGVEWDIKFTTEDDLQYHWMGEFENKKSDRQNLQGNEYKVLKETLIKNTKTIIQRDNQTIHFKESILPKLSSFQSTIHILSEEGEIAPVKKCFRQIEESMNHASESIISIFKNIQFKLVNTSIAKELEKYSSLTLENLYEIDLTKHEFLILMYKNLPPVFEKIKNDFIEIFPFIEEVKIQINEEESDYEIKFKEKGVDGWINEDKISSGMIKTFMCISDLYRYPNGTVLLIDEFENSLGVNCIDTLSNLISENRNLQFIITSHHPYIINKIGMEYWKIITRKGGIVTARDAREFNLGKSRHEAFMQLINLDAYTEGISVE